MLVGKIKKLVIDLTLYIIIYKVVFKDILTMKLPIRHPLTLLKMVLLYW